jgi:gas vesicle protein
MNGRNNYAGEVALFLTGVGTGLAVGMLFAPRSGKENRRLIREKAQEGKDLLKNSVDQGQEYIKRRGADLVDQANEQIDRAKNAVSKQKDEFSGAVQAGVDAYARTVEAASK